MIEFSETEQEDGKIFTMSIQLTNKIDIYSRTYNKLQDLGAQIGAVYGALHMVLAIIFQFYNNLINDKNLTLLMKQFNYKDKKGKEVQRIENLLSHRKKYKKFHKTYNNFNTKELNLPQENNKNENRKQGKNIINKNYGFKNKAKQEMELINGAIEYLQNNQNKSTKKLLNNNKISLEIIQKKYNEINENNYEYKNRRMKAR